MPLIHPQSFRALDVWQRAMDLVDEAYMCTRGLPRSEFDLRRQIRKAAVSIPSNLAEGHRRGRRLAYQNHVSIALGSTAELETEIEIALRNGLLETTKCEVVVALSDRVSAMLFRLHDALDAEHDRSGR
jgi:four helix bundle protein